MLCCGVDLPGSFSKAESFAMFPAMVETTERPMAIVPANSNTAAICALGRIETGGVDQISGPECYSPTSGLCGNICGGCLLTAQA